MANSKKPPGGVIFRRFIRRKDGSLDDAHAHGLRAWPIRPGDKKPRK
jgi:hypothetical protein